MTRAVKSPAFLGQTYWPRKVLLLNELVRGGLGHGDKLCEVA